jgi:hypothetical protein
MMIEDVLSQKKPPLEEIKLERKGGKDVRRVVHDEPRRPASGLSSLRPPVRKVSVRSIEN